MRAERRIHLRLSSSRSPRLPPLTLTLSRVYNKSAGGNTSPLRVQIMVKLVVNLVGGGLSWSRTSEAGRTVRGSAACVHAKDLLFIHKAINFHVLFRWRYENLVVKSAI